MAEGATKKKSGRPKGRKSGYTVSEKALVARQNNSPMVYPKPAETDEERDYNARQIEHIKKVHEIGAMADRNDLVSLRSCFLAYLELCQRDGFKVSNMAAYASMGMNRFTFEYLKKKNDPDTRALTDFVQSVCAMSRESMISDGKLNPVIGIFWQRNFDGLRNDTEQIQAIEEQEDRYAQFGGSSYKDRYRNLIGSNGDKG